MIGVLVVHKEENMRELIQDMIIVRGDEYEVVMTDSADSALETIRDQPISLAIVDFQAISDYSNFAKEAKALNPKIAIAISVDNPEEVGEGANVRFKTMDLHKRLDEILALATKPA